MRVFLDLDGVLVNFLGSALRGNNIRAPDPWPMGVWDMFDAIKVADQIAFWRAFDDEDFWAHLDWMPKGRRILNLLEATLGEDNICLLTSPTYNPGCHNGKMRWIREHMPNYRRKTLIGACKHFCAHPGSLLIDDSPENIEKFKVNGGCGILIKTLWNGHGEDIDTVQELSSDLRKIIEGI